MEAANAVHDKRTVEALLVLAGNYEYRANEARARLPSPKDNPQPQAAPGPDAEAPKSEEHESAEDDMATVSADPAQRYIPMSSGLEDHDPKANAEAETQLNQATAEIEELWQRLNELGLSSSGGSDKTHILMSSRHLSSSLGDSFCLLPTKARSHIGVHATAIDGVSTLRAAVASRMRDQRVRLMEKQYGPRAAIHHPRGSLGSRDDIASIKDDELHIDPGYVGGSDSRRSSLSNHASELEALQETVTHHKYEIVRLLNTVKTLSNENTTLLKKCEVLSKVQDENKELQDSLEKFKAHYNQKLIMIKRALEEWRRQQNRVAVPGGSHQNANGDLREKLEAQERQIAMLTDTIRKKG
ncbi:hypothetical protein PINS_up000432 [Pythium insidiosum]|nr:hypothetical protein PINS_up000432 [Pythium insidiosum]